MKKLTSLILLLCLTLNMAYADCDFSTGITAGPNHTFIYSEACHQKVGQLVQDNAVQAQQIQDYQKAITLKDLAISYSDSRVAMWQKTSLDEQDRLVKIESEQKNNDFIYFGLGILATIGAGFMTARILSK